MSRTTLASAISKLLLPLALSVFIQLIWDGSLSYAFFLREHIPVSKISVSWWQYPLFIALGLGVGLIADRFPIKKALPVTGAFLFFWLIASLLSLEFFEVNLYFLRVAFISVAVVGAVHLRKLWLIDQQLTENLVNLAMTGDLLELRPAEARIEQGLRLLETVLPLSEAIVFTIDETGQFRPVGRSRPDSRETNIGGRQAEWRETVAFCERSFSERKTIVHMDGASGSARVALPLIHENLGVGVLCVRVHQNFERADQYLLEAFCDQLARNFKRRELRSKDLPNRFWWSFLSTHMAEHRVGTTGLIKSLIKEQSFAAVASSYLKEAHAIAYLDGTLAYVNRQMRHLIDLGSSQIIDLDLFALLGNFRTEAFSEPHLAIRRVLQTGEVYRNELEFAAKDKILDLQISLVKVPFDDVSIHDTNVALKPACFLITLTDITAVKENEQLRSDMARLMSHELRTPVTSIKGFAELLMMDETMSTENREFLEIIASESNRLSKMLSTFLSVANLEQSDKREVTKAAVRIDSIVGEVVGEFRDDAKRKRIRLVEQNAGNLPPIAADRGLIRRAIANLIDNAIRYSPERTQVMISTILEADFLRVVVEDRGYGIDRSEHEKIWEKFYRVARDGRNKEDVSTGLGLSLVKEVVEQHGGNVGVESEVGRGSRFSIRLPRL